MFPDEKKESAIAALKASVAYYESLGVTVARVMTDNGSGYKSHAFRDACAGLGLRHIRTGPYTPKTNGKAERFIQTALREWAYAQTYQTSDLRPPNRRAACLAAPLQRASATWRDRVPDTHQPTRPQRGQPIESSQLAAVDRLDLARDQAISQVAGRGPAVRLRQYGPQDAHLAHLDHDGAVKDLVAERRDHARQPPVPGERSGRGAYHPLVVGQATTQIKGIVPTVVGVERALPSAIKAILRRFTRGIALASS